MSFISELQSKSDNINDIEKRAKDILLTHYFSQLDDLYIRMKQYIAELARNGKYVECADGKRISGLFVFDVPFCNNPNDTSHKSTYPFGYNSRGSSVEEKFLFEHKDNKSYLFSLFNTPLSMDCDTYYRQIGAYSFELCSLKSEKFYNFLRTKYYYVEAFCLNNMGHLVNNHISELASNDGISASLVYTFSPDNLDNVKRVAYTNSLPSSSSEKRTFFFDGEEIRSKWDCKIGSGNLAILYNVKF